MLCYSSDDIIELLPALPEEWKNGSVKGLCARGGYSLDFTWENGKIKICRYIRPAAKDGTH